MNRRFFPLLFICAVITVHVFAVEPVRHILSNGMQLVTLNNASSNLVSVEVLIDCSALDEPLSVKGLRQVLLTSMLQGSATMDGDSIEQKIADAGGIIRGRVQQDVIEFSLTVPPTALSTGLQALSEMICHPRLSDDGILSALAQAKQTAQIGPSGVVDMARWYSHELLYFNLPYATSGLGTTGTLDRITPALVRLANTYFVTPRHTVVAVVGNCTPQQARDVCESAFAGWQSSMELGVASRESVPTPKIEESQLILRESPVQSSCIMLTFPVCGAKDPDFLTLRLIETILSGGTGSRLFQDIREQQHLAYEVSTFLANQLADSYFSIYALSHSRYIDDTKTALAAELSRLQTQPISNNELQRAKGYLKGTYLLSHQSNAQYAYDLAWYNICGFPDDYDRTFGSKIDAITAADIQRVARAYFTHYYLVVVVPQSVNTTAK